MNDLTIVLVLKDRFEFTLRWLEYMNGIYCEYKILIADGSIQNDTYNLFKTNDNNYPNLNIQYYRFPEDVNIEVYIKKLYNSIDLITTKYSILADNDDFFILDEIPKYIEFLNTNDSYIAAKGATIDLVLTDNIFVETQIKPLTKSKFYRATIRNVNAIDQEFPCERVEYSCNNFIKKDYFSNWYSIYHTEVLKKTMYEIMNSKVDCLFVFEILLHTLNTYQGKIYIDNKPFYIRQYGASSSGGYFTNEKLTSDLLIENNFNQFYSCLRNSNIIKDEDILQVMSSIFKCIQIFFGYRFLYEQKKSKIFLSRIIQIIKSNNFCFNLLLRFKNIFIFNELNSVKPIELKIIEKYISKKY